METRQKFDTIAQNKFDTGPNIFEKMRQSVHYRWEWSEYNHLLKFSATGFIRYSENYRVRTSKDKP